MQVVLKLILGLNLLVLCVEGVYVKFQRKKLTTSPSIGSTFVDIFEIQT